MNELHSQFAAIQDEDGNKDKFEDYFTLNADARQRVVKSPDEFWNFSCIKRVCRDINFDSKDPGRHSMAQASHFTTFFVQTPARNVRREDEGYVFGE